ncbi:MAG: dihydrofolate reductase [Muribaculaceae bacterium]|nr:dihydrofolate reductase [Muribaculaceae bacterium]
MTISIIVATGKHNAIGAHGNLAFHISADLKHFKAITMGKPIVMGRKTFESLPNGALPGRRNIVITRNPGFSAPGVETASSLDSALRLAGDADEVMIIGGAQIYSLAMPFADKLYITEIDAERPDADTFFPAINPAEWQSTPEQWLTDPKSGLKYRFICHFRK